MRWVDLLHGRGPDQFLELELRCDDDARLRALVGDVVRERYQRTVMVGPVMAAPFRVPKLAPAWDFYADALSHRELVSSLRRTVHHGLSWAFCALWCGAKTLWLEHAGSFAMPQCDAAEAAVLAALTQARWLEVRAWSLEHGGDGYPRRVAFAGVGSASLRTALGL
jgi:hypothetical protein